MSLVREIFREKKTFLFLFVTWGVSILSFIRGLLVNSPLNSVADFFIPICVVATIIFSFRVVIKKIKLIDLLFVAICVVIFYLNYIFFPKNQYYLAFIQSRFCFCVIPFFFVGLFVDINSHERKLEFISILVVISEMLYVLYKSIVGISLSDDGEEESMGKAYLILPHLLFLSYMMFQKFKLWRVAMVLVSLILMLGFGNRGTVLLFLFFVFIYFFFIHRFDNPLRGRFLLCLSIVLLLVVFLEFVYLVAPFLNSLGMSSRTIDFFIRGEYFISQGRGDIKQILYDNMFVSPIFGFGLCGDRRLCGGTGLYAHVIFLEFLISFGVVQGCLLFLVICLMIVFSFILTKNVKKRTFLLILICCGFLKLFISSSFLIERFFWFLLGYCVSLLRKKHLSYIKNALFLSKKKLEL